MDDIIIQLDAVRRALGTLNITSTRRNLDVLLGSMQAIDQSITALQQIKLKQEEKEESDNERNEG